MGYKLTNSLRKTLIAFVMAFSVLSSSTANSIGQIYNNEISYSDENKDKSSHKDVLLINGSDEKNRFEPYITSMSRYAYKNGINLSILGDGKQSIEEYELIQFLEENLKDKKML